MLDLHRFCALRRHLFHLTSRANRDCIVYERSLHPAATIFQRANRADLLEKRRRHHATVPFCQTEVHVRDQAPLHAGAIDFELGWDIARWVRHVNDHVFFWPGSAAGPVRYGINHYERYRGEAPILLRIRTQSLFLADATLQPRFSRFNSGAPRCSGGVRSPRGASTYLEAEAFTGPGSDVKEVVFPGSVALPGCTEVSDSFEGPWRALFPLF